MVEKVFRLVRAVDELYATQPSKQREDGSITATSSAAIPPKIVHSPINSRSQGVDVLGTAGGQAATYSPLSHDQTPFASLQPESLELSQAQSPSVKLRGPDERPTVGLTSKGKERQAITREDASKDGEIEILRSEGGVLPPALALATNKTEKPKETGGEKTRSDFSQSASPMSSLHIAALAMGETTPGTKEEISGQVEEIDPPRSSPNPKFTVTDVVGDQEHRDRGNEDTRVITASNDSDRIDRS